MFLTVQSISPYQSLNPGQIKQSVCLKQRGSPKLPVAIFLPLTALCNDLEAPGMRQSLQTQQWPSLEQRQPNLVHLKNKGEIAEVRNGNVEIIPSPLCGRSVCTDCRTIRHLSM